MKYYIARAKEIRNSINTRQGKHNMKYYSNFALLHKREIASRLVNKLIRSINTNNIEMKYFKRKLEGKEDLIDFSTRKGINNISKSAAAIKCYYGLNYYRQCDYKINQGISTNEYLRYSSREIWEYIIQYPEINQK